MTTGQRIIILKAHKLKLETRNSELKTAYQKLRWIMTLEWINTLTSDFGHSTSDQ
jgi:hypothetical protein